MNDSMQFDEALLFGIYETYEYIMSSIQSNIFWNFKV